MQRKNGHHEFEGLLCKWQMLGIDEHIGVRPVSSGDRANFLAERRVRSDRLPECFATAQHKNVRERAVDRL